MTSTTVNDTWLRIAGITLLWVISCFANGFHTQLITAEGMIRMLISLISLTVTWHVIRALIIYYRKPIYPGRKSQKDCY